jgi:integrase
MASVWTKSYELKRGGRSYSIYYKDPATGETRHYMTLRKKTIADQKANELKTFIDSGKWPEIEKGKKKFRPLTLRDCSDAYIKKCERRVVREKMSEVSLSFYRDQHRMVLKDLVETTQVSTISEEMIEKYHLEVRDDISCRTANARLLALKMMFKIARKENAVSEDAAKDVGYFPETVRKRSLKPQELDLLLEASRKTKSSKAMTAAILLGVEHGASRQEILELREVNIDFDQSGIGTIRFFRRKNDEERLQFLMPRTRKALRELLDHRAYMRHRKKMGEVKSDLVFGRLDGRPIERIDSAWERVLAIAGISDFHFHDLRTVYASNLAYAGAGLSIVQKLLGHKDARSTERYIHIQQLLELRPWQARLAAMYEDPAAFNQLLAEGGV